MDDWWKFVDGFIECMIWLLLSRCEEVLLFGCSEYVLLVGCSWLDFKEFWVLIIDCMVGCWYWLDLIVVDIGWWFGGIIYELLRYLMFWWVGGIIDIGVWVEGRWVWVIIEEEVWLVDMFE